MYQKCKSIWQHINNSDYLVFFLCLLAFIGFNEQITTFLSKYFVSWLSFERNLWIDSIIVLVSIILFCYAKNKGPAKYATKHVLIYAAGCFMFLYYSIDSTFCYTKAFTVFPYYLILLMGVGLGGWLRFIGEQKVRKNIKSVEDKHNIQTDAPIFQSKDDILGYTVVAKDIEKIIEEKKTEQAFSIGVVAPWGTGKSSLLNLLKQQLKGNEHYILIEFNPRSSVNAQSIQEDFLNILRDKMKEYHSSFTSYVNDYMKTLQLIDEKNPISAWVSHIGLDSVEKSRDRISDIIRSSGRKLVVLVDDLDRLTGEEIIEILKLIDKNASFPNTFFVSAYDKEYVNQVLEHYLANDHKRDFTDKFFNLERMLPERSYSQKLNILEKLLVKAAKEHLIEPEQYEIANILIEAKDECERLLPTIRDIKRFYNMFIMEYIPIKQNVILKEFFLLSLIKYAEPIEYRKLLSQEYIENNIMTGYGKAYQLKSSITADTVKCYKILEKLFPVKSTNSVPYYSDYFKHISYIRAFDTYFKGYMIGSLYHSDLAPLMDEQVSLEQVVKLFKQWGTVENQQDITDYLLTMTYYKLTSVTKLQRYIQVLLIYTYVYDLNFNYLNALLIIFGKRQSADTAIDKIKNLGFENEAQYKKFLHDILINRVLPIYFVKFLNWLIYNIVHDQEISATSIFTFQEISEINLQNLNKAINCITDSRSIEQSDIEPILPSHIYTLMTGCIDHLEGVNSILSEKALDSVRNSMNKCPLFYAPYLLTHIQELNKKDEVQMTIRPTIAFDQLFPEGKEQLFDDYLTILKDYKNADSQETALQYKTLSLFWQRYKQRYGQFLKFKIDENITPGDYKKYAALLEAQ